MLTEAIKIVFGVSVAVSFPLVVFPCRTAIHSLCFKNPGYNTPLDMSSASYIPPNRSNAITLAIVLITLIVGIMIPDIEFVLGLVGSTIGNVVCILLPSIIFVRLNQRNTTERLAAQLIFCIGLVLMIVGTYVNLHMADSTTKVLGKDKVEVLDNINKIVVDSPPLINPMDVNEKPKVVADPALINEKKDVRVEPVEPHAPKEVDEAEKDVVKGSQADEKELKKSEEDSPKDVKAEKEKEAELKAKEEKADKLLKELEKQKEEHKQIIEEQKEVLDRMKQHLEADETQDQNKLDQEKAGSQNNRVVQPPPQQVNSEPLSQSSNLNQEKANLPLAQQSNQHPPKNIQQQPGVNPQVVQQQQPQKQSLPNLIQPQGQYQQQQPQRQPHQQYLPLDQNVVQQANTFNDIGNPKQGVQQQQPNVNLPLAQQQPLVQPNNPNLQVVQQQQMPLQNIQMHQNQPQQQNYQNVPPNQNMNQWQNQQLNRQPLVPQQGGPAQMVQRQDQVNPPSQDQQVNLHAPHLKNNLDSQHQGQVGPGFKAMPQMNQRPPQQPQSHGQPVAETLQVKNESSEKHKDFKRAAREKVGRDLKHF